jgi:hypothetical protein
MTRVVGVMIKALFITQDVPVDMQIADGLGEKPLKMVNKDVVDQEDSRPCVIAPPCPP